MMETSHRGIVTLCSRQLDSVFMRVGNGAFAGVRLGPYEIAAQIGVGGMGKVYRATETKLDRDVAV